MHVLIAAHDFYPDPESGGSGRYVYETGRRLVDRGHDVSVLTRRRGPVSRWERVDGIDVYRYDLSIANTQITDVLPQLPDAVGSVADVWVKLMDENPPDLLSFQGPVSSLLVDGMADPEIPRICTFHSPWPTEYLLRTRYGSTLSPPRRRLNAAVRKRLERYTLGRCDRVVTLSRFMGRELRRCYDTVGPNSIVPGGVDTAQFAPDAGRFSGIDSDGFAILTVRRLTPRMGHDLLLEAFASVADEYPSATLYLAGDGALRDDLEAKAAALGVANRTRFLGYLPDEQLPAAYASADLFVLPTTELEGFGLATLEALSSGTPVLATPVGGTVEILSELETRPDIPAPVLAPAATADALAAGLRSWLATAPIERSAAADACRAYARRNYRWERTVDELERLYANATASSAPGQSLPID